MKYWYTKYTRRQDANTAMKPIRKMPMMAAVERLANAPKTGALWQCYLFSYG